jgi:EAL domain-containing protein (putative c-di-GMP-specific phosphodiesterase class I)
VGLAKGEIRGFEALVRWQHPTRGVLSPALFIPLAEETGMIVPLGRWVLRAACREAAKWQDIAAPGGPPTRVSVNVSARQLDHPSFLSDVVDTLVASKLHPDRLVLEITESVIMRDGATLDRLHALKNVGVTLAIDDFGTGYSSLASLQRIPADVLKVDKAFVKSIANGGNDAALARTIVALAEVLGLATVAEGIEHSQQWTTLAALGCTEGQGYYFARPMSDDRARDMLRGGQRLPVESAAAPWVPRKLALVSGS